MKHTKRHRITCLACNGSNVAVISGVRTNEYMIDLNADHKKQPPKIIAGRYRRDMKFGWECMCGNDSRVARQEFGDIGTLVVNGGRTAIAKITEGLKTEEDKKFRMEEV